MNEIKTFINNLGLSAATDSEPVIENNLRETITRELPFNDIYTKLIASKQENIRFKEIIVESEIDFIKSVNQLKAVFELQLNEAIEKVNDIYSRELLNLKSLYHKEYFGDSLLKLIKKLNENEFSLIMMNSRVYAYRYYSPALDVSEGRFESGKIHEYDEPVCQLKGVYINLLHPKVTNGTVLINTNETHPNAKQKGLSEACVGSLEDHDIPVNDPDLLLGLLNEICEMYEVMHLDSAYFIPEGSYTCKKGELKWTA